MKCKKCGAEIDGDSRYCEQCGARQSKGLHPKVWIAIAASVVLVVALVVVLATGNVNTTEEVPIVEYADYTDLGLPSGKSWKNSNEDGGFYTYDEAVNQFGGSLPTREDWEELKDECQWNWMGDGYKVTGPNGNSIALPAAGWRYCDGSAGSVGSGGVYWSSTPNGSEDAWYLYFDSSSSVGMSSAQRCYGNSVRLVQE